MTAFWKKSIFSILIVLTVVSEESLLSFPSRLRRRLKLLVDPWTPHTELSSSSSRRFASFRLDFTALCPHAQSSTSVSSCAEHTYHRLHHQARQPERACLAATGAPSHSVPLFS